MIIHSKGDKAQSSLIDLLGGNAKKTSTTKSNDLFSKLLNSFGMQVKDSEMNITASNDFKTVIDPKNQPTNPSVKKGDLKPSLIKELQSLLSGSDEKESLLVSKELIGTLSSDQVRTLIYRAKEYLKNEITTKVPEYQAETKSLPKTLLGLVQLAEKMGLEPQSISLSTLISDEQERSAFTPEILTKPLLETKMVAALPIAAPEETTFEAITQLLREIKGKEQKNTDRPLTEPLEDKETKKTSESQPLKALLQNIDKRETIAPTVAAEKTPVTATPAATVLVALATSPSANTPETEKAVQHTTINPKAESLLTLLQGSNESNDSKSEGSHNVKIEGDSSKAMHVPKADSIEVKSKEAQQSMRIFAGELKEAVQEYKPPFTRLTMKLNPEKLGEVEVTLVQRGNNVHVNIQSNNTSSIAFLAHNATELKAQLAQLGITNATMNFMSGGENQQQSNAQNQQHQQEQRQNAFQSYESFEELTLNEEQLSALEIIIPHYA